ncbi:MAG: glucose-1-phosphate adenylyltransferase subunit GlgD [Ruminococcaceae bacterium]|nr:glucose-1-phosphate adenylyltransferase subunit GlgD [Oscillospiraceae bacterium]
MQDTMGIILTESEDVTLRELTEMRSTAALPIAGRYRLIDFVLSGLVNSGIINVGVATKHKYLSIMDHLGAGSSWDLQREHYGLFILPPYANYEKFGNLAGDLDVLMGIMPYLRRSRQKYVILTEGNTVCNITFQEAMRQHKETEADITVIYREETGEPSRFLMLETEADGHICDLAFRPQYSKSRKAAMDMFIMEKELLIRIIEGAAARGEHSFVMGALVRRQESLRMYGWEFKGYARKVDSVASYFDCNMDVLREEVQTALFCKEEPIFTKVKNRVPTRYGDSAALSSCLVADGCVLEGHAENCVFFRGVKLGKHSHLKNCIVMEKSHIDTNCVAENVIFDKECLMREGRRLTGQPNYPIIIRKGAVI